MKLFSAVLLLVFAAVASAQAPAPPDISPASGPFTGPVQVTITERTPGPYEIHYTTDGTAPSASSPLYTGPFTVSATGVNLVRAIAVVIPASGLSAATYTISVPLPVSVSVNPTSAAVQTSKTQAITATVLNDTQSKGVTWTLTGSGTLSSVAGPTTTYVAPAALPVPAIAIVTAKSVADPTKFATATLTITAPPPTCPTSTAAWASVPFSAATGNYRVEFDSTPSAVNMDGVVGVAATPATAYGNLSLGVRFNAQGNIDAISGTGYTPVAPIPYKAGTAYHFTLDVSGSTYTASVKSGTTSTVIGTALSFRAAATTLAQISFISEVGSETVCNLVVTPGVTPPTPHTVTLNWNAPLSSKRPTSLSATQNQARRKTGTAKAKLKVTLDGYNVYRSTTTGGPYQKINPSLVTGTTYTDSGVVAGSKYFYVATSVATGLESLNSNEASATIPTP